MTGVPARREYLRRLEEAVSRPKCTRSRLPLWISVTGETIKQGLLGVEIVEVLVVEDVVVVQGGGGRGGVDFGVSGFYMRPTWFKRAHYGT